jgi:hypothetical protein
MLMRTAADPAEDAEQEAQIWEDVVHIYEPLAQSCAAVGLNALAAVYYGLCVDAITHLPPQFVIDESSLANDTAPRITAARFVPMMLNQQATELTSAGDYAAALQTLCFSRATAELELASLCRRKPSSSQVARLQRDIDELHGIIAYCLSQCSSCVLELCSRLGMSELAMPDVSWLQANGQGRNGRCAVLVQKKPVVMPLNPEQARRFVCDALQLSRGKHIDSYLQAAFSLGDLALSRYDLDEAMRVFSLVALVSAHGQVSTATRIRFSAVRCTALRSSCVGGRFRLGVSCHDTWQNGLPCVLSAIRVCTAERAKSAYSAAGVASHPVFPVVTLTCCFKAQPLSRHVVAVN